MLVEGDDRTRGAGVGVGVEHHGGLVGVGDSTEHALGDQLVHLEVCLVEPEPTHRGGVEIEAAEVVVDVGDDEGTDLFEDLVAVLTEDQLVGVALAVLRQVEETAVVADVVGELRRERRPEDLPAGARGDRLVGPLEHERGAGVAEDEVEVAQLEVVVGRSDLGVDDQHT